MGVNCVGPLICGFFVLVNNTIGSQAHRSGGTPYMEHRLLVVVDFQLHRGSASLTLCVVYISTNVNESQKCLEQKQSHVKHAPYNLKFFFF